MSRLGRRSSRRFMIVGGFIARRNGIRRLGRFRRIPVGRFRVPGLMTMDSRWVLLYMCSDIYISPFVWCE